jgi:hypothetical protein
MIGLLLNLCLVIVWLLAGYPSAELAACRSTSDDDHCGVSTPIADRHYDHGPRPPTSTATSRLLPPTTDRDGLADHELRGRHAVTVDSNQSSATIDRDPSTATARPRPGRPAPAISDRARLTTTGDRDRWRTGLGGSDPGHGATNARLS